VSAQPGTATLLEELSVVDFGGTAELANLPPPKEEMHR
jgi:hypothetical protein